MLAAVFLQTPPGCAPDCVVQAAHTATRIRVDGVLDESVWEQAVPAGDFLQYAPDEGAPATLDTQVYLLHDARTLFIGAKLADPESNRIRRMLGRRDELSPGDWFVVSLDTYDDRKTSFNFAINAAGVRVEGMGVDAMLPDGSGRPMFFASEALGFDPAWDVEWSGAARQDHSGWTVELAIPFSALEMAHPGRREAGINFRRWAARRGELSEWSLTRSRERSHGPVAHFGRVRFAAEIDPGVHRTITPHVNTFRVEVEEESDTFPFLPLPGVEGTLAFRPSLTLDISLLPDLTPENFEEYAAWTLGPYANRKLVYPRLFTAARHVIESPHIVGSALETTEDAQLMLGALALHGRMPFGLTVGATGMAAPNSWSIDQGYAARIVQDVGTLSKIGFTGVLGPAVTTSVYTRMGDTTWTNLQIDRMASVSSVDWDLRFGENTRRVAGQVLLSRERVLRSREDVVTIIDAPPGFGGYSNDVLRSLRGFAARLDFEQIGRRWNWYGRGMAMEPNFRTGPSGMTGRTDRMLFTAGVHHTLAKDFFVRLARRGRISMQWTNEFAYADMDFQATRLEGYAALLTRRYNEVALSAAGGVSPSGSGRWGGDFRISSDIRRKWVVRPYVWLDRVDKGVLNRGASAEVTGQVWSRISASAEAGVDRYAFVTDALTDLSRLSMRPSGVDILRLWPAWDYTIGYRRRDAFYVPHSLLYGSGRVAENVQAEFRQSYGRVRLAIGILKSLDIELGAGVQAIGCRCPAGEGVAARRALWDNQATLFAGIHWEYKQGSILALGVLEDRTAPEYPSWDTTWDLFAMPFETGTSRERFYLLRLSRKIWR